MYRLDKSLGKARLLCNYANNIVGCCVPLLYPFEERPPHSGNSNRWSCSLVLTNQNASRVVGRVDSRVVGLTVGLLCI